MDGRDLEKLFLLEILVENINFASNKELETLKETCIEFKFLNLPRIIVCEEDFAQNTSYDTSEVPFNSGKSCLFSLPSNIKFGSLNVDFIVTRADDSGKRDLGHGEISLGSDFLSVIQSQNEKDGVPVSKTVRNVYVFKRNDNSTAGKAVIFIRLSCFGRLIVTQFQVKNIENQEFVFENEKTMVDLGQALQAERIDEFTKGGIKPPPPSIPPPLPPPTTRPPPINIPVPPPPSIPPPQMPPLLQTPIPSLEYDPRRGVPSSFPFGVHVKPTSQTGFPSPQEPGLLPTDSDVDNIKKRLQEQIDRRKQQQGLPTSDPFQRTNLPSHFPHQAAPFGSPPQRFIDPYNAPTVQPFSAPPSAAQSQGYFGSPLPLSLTPNSAQSAGYFGPSQPIAISPSAAQPQGFFGQTLPLSMAPSAVRYPAGYFGPGKTYPVGDQVLLQPPLIPGAFEQQGASVPQAAFKTSGAMGSQPKYPGQIHPQMSNLSTPVQSRPDQQKIPGVFEVPGYTIPMSYAGQRSQEGGDNKDIQQQVGQFPSTQVQSDETKPPVPNAGQVLSDPKKSSPVKKEVPDSSEEVSAKPHAQKGKKGGKKGTQQKQKAHTQVKGKAAAKSGGPQQTLGQKHSPPRAGKDTEAHELEHEIDEIVARGDEFLGLMKPKGQSSPKPGAAQKATSPKKQPGKKEKGGKKKGKGKPKGGKKGKKAKKSRSPAATSAKADQYLELLKCLSQQKQDHDQLARRLQSHINEHGPRVQKQQAWPPQGVPMEQIQEFWKQQFRRLPAFIGQQMAQSQRLMGQRMELEQNLANLQRQLVQLQQQRYAQKQPLPFQPLLSSTSATPPPGLSLGEQCLQQENLLKQQYLEHQQLQHKLLQEQGLNEKILSDLQKPLPLQAMQQFQDALKQFMRQLEMQDALMRNHLAQQHNILGNQIMHQKVLEGQTPSPPADYVQLPVSYSDQTAHTNSGVQMKIPLGLDIPLGPQPQTGMQQRTQPTPQGMRGTYEVQVTTQEGNQKNPCCFEIGQNSLPLRYPVQGDTMCWTGPEIGTNVVWFGKIGPDGKALWEGKNV